MKILLIGATGTIGKPIAYALKSQGHEVIEASRKSGLDISKPEILKKYLKDMELVDHIISTGGGVHFGSSLKEITDEQLYEGIHSKLMGQCNIVRFGIDRVKKGGSILLTGGILAYKPIFPNSSQVGLVNSGLNGFVIGAAEDFKETGVRINVIHPPLIQETAKAVGMPGDGLPTAAEAANVFLNCTFKETGTGQEYLFPK